MIDNITPYIPNIVTVMPDGSTPPTIFNSRATLSLVINEGQGRFTTYVATSDGGHKILPDGARLDLPPIVGKSSPFTNLQRLLWKTL